MLHIKGKCQESKPDTPKHYYKEKGEMTYDDDA